VAGRKLRHFINPLENKEHAINIHKNYLTTCLLASSALLASSPSFAADAPGLGEASNFTALSAADEGRGAVTCTDAAVIGDIGSSGFPAAVVETGCARQGLIIAPVSAAVLADFQNAYTSLQSTHCERILTGTLDSVTLPPGVYCFEQAAVLTGTVRLAGPSTGVWIFLVNGDLTGNIFTTLLSGGAQGCNVFWGPSGAATMTDSNLQGTVVAGAAITLTRGTFVGRALAKDAVTMTGVAATGCN
jgi:hypothetical protein